jgi:hypothetical protein
MIDGESVSVPDIVLMSSHYDSKGGILIELLVTPENGTLPWI